MSSSTQPRPGVLSIRFTRRIARQCRLQGRLLPDWAVCDTVANGTRRLLESRGPLGGQLVRFERTYGARGTVAVLGELVDAGVVARKLLLPSRGGKKTGRIWDF